MRGCWRWVVIALAVVLVLIVIGPLVVPIPPLRGTVPPQELAGPDSQFIDTLGLRVHVLDRGSGRRALILLHGFGASVFSWREVIAPLADAGFRVIAFDRPAYGLTSRPMPGEWTGDNPYGTPAQVDLTLALMDELGLERAVLVGNSAGGTIASLVALAHPERVEALILVDAAIYSGGGTPAWVRPLLLTPQMRRIGPLFARSIGGRGPDLIRSAWYDGNKVTEDVIEGYKLPLRAENWDRSLWEATLTSRTEGLAERIGEIQLPALVITGDSDTWVPTEQSLRLAGELPNAMLAVMPQCGHVPQEECPHPTLEAMLSFLETLP